MMLCPQMGLGRRGPIPHDPRAAGDGVNFMKKSILLVFLLFVLSRLAIVVGCVSDTYPGYFRLDFSHTQLHY